MHYRYDPYALGLIQIDHRVRKTTRQCATSWRTKLKKALRLTPDFLNEPFDFVVETAAQLWRDNSIILNRLCDASQARLFIKVPIKFSRFCSAGLSLCCKGRGLR